MKRKIFAPIQVWQISPACSLTSLLYLLSLHFSSLVYLFQEKTGGTVQSVHWRMQSPCKTSLYKAVHLITTLQTAPSSLHHWLPLWPVPLRECTTHVAELMHFMCISYCRLMNTSIRYQSSQIENETSLFAEIELVGNDPSSHLSSRWQWSFAIETLINSIHAKRWDESLYALLLDKYSTGHWWSEGPAIDQPPQTMSLAQPDTLQIVKAGVKSRDHVPLEEWLCFKLLLYEHFFQVGLLHFCHGNENQSTYSYYWAVSIHVILWNIMEEPRFAGKHSAGPHWHEHLPCSVTSFACFLATSAASAAWRASNRSPTNQLYPTIGYYRL